MLVSVTLGSFAERLRPAHRGGRRVGTMVAIDRRTSGAQIDDQNIELRAAAGVSDNLGIAVHVNITSYNRRVLLTGEVPTQQDKQLVEQIVTGRRM